MKYQGYLKSVARQLDALFTNIAAHYNFDYGDEFEIALCHALRQILPTRYGVCRGFVVSEDNDVAGDDIIIYDREAFPTLRLLPQESFERKNDIPVEAVYAYIEAKHSLVIAGNDGQSIERAWSQVSKVKSLSRAPRSPLQYDSHLSFSDQFAVTRDGWHDILNPFYGAIVAFQVRYEKGSPPIQDAEQVFKLMNGVRVDVKPGPDLIIAGPNNIVVPFVSVDKMSAAVSISSPFYIEGETGLTVRNTPGHAFAIGLCTLLWAIDTIRLGPLSWHRVLEEGINSVSS